MVKSFFIVLTKKKLFFIVSNRGDTMNFKHFPKDESPLNRITQVQSISTGSQRQLADYIVSHAAHVPSLSISDLAAEAGVSETTVVRFCRILGYTGYREFREKMLENRGALRGTQLFGIDIPEDLKADEPLDSIARKVMQINSAVLLETHKVLNLDELKRAVDVIVGARQVLCVGFGSSAPVAIDAYQRLLRLGIRAAACNDPHIVASATVYMSAEDLLFAVSYGGASRDTVEALQTAQEQRASTILLTAYRGSPAAKHADIVLVSAVHRILGRTETISSRIAQLAVMDVILTAVALKRGPEFLEHVERLEYELGKKRYR